MTGPWDAVIWDFNGTLVDDVELALAAINTMLARRGLPAVSREVYRSVFGFPLMDYYRKLGIDITRETPQNLADEFHSAYLPGLPACGLQKGVREILDLIAQDRSRPVCPLGARGNGIAARARATLASPAVSPASTASIIDSATPSSPAAASSPGATTSAVAACSSSATWTTTPR